MQGAGGIWSRMAPARLVAAVDEIDVEELWEAGYRGIILDIDNTIAPWHGSEPVAAAEEWVERAKHRGFRVCLVSNARAARIRSFAARLGVGHVEAGRKPGRRPFLEAQKLLGLPPSQIVVVGDQLLTDVWGARRLGFQALLVDPISPREFLATRLARRLEAFVLRQLARRRLVRPEAEARRRRRVFSDGSQEGEK